MTANYTLLQAPSVNWNPTTHELEALNEEAISHANAHQQRLGEFENGELKYTVNYVGDGNKKKDSEVKKFITQKYPDDLLTLRQKQKFVGSKDSSLSKALTLAISGNTMESIVGKYSLGAASGDLI
ncbi:hypothetical protein JQC92_19035 [Shewanella sp. 202IG2-18]|uniref:hypothetical protein n=1 Tax=Parashewanella hymeniacidonis TaxID=2807618 RepID=UPI00195F3AA1|nr:hypothetical protein [Parashewanella hymeniacidonis]MBM7074102.1 hypothetical protein [Parashewanella hymeniacidonis]